MRDKSVTAISANDVWAAGGEYNTNGTVESPVTMHYDGKKWSLVPISAVGNYGTTLVEVVGTSSKDAWAIGDSWVSSVHNNYKTLAEHWNGKKWTVVTTPDTTGPDNVFNSAVAIAQNDVWAIGDYWNGSIFQTLTEHYDGNAWSIVKSPNSGTYGDGYMRRPGFRPRAMCGPSARSTAPAARRRRSRSSGTARSGPCRRRRT